jgi:hypothetical protein
MNYMGYGEVGGALPPGCSIYYPYQTYVKTVVAAQWDAYARANKTNNYAAWAQNNKPLFTTGYYAWLQNQPASVVDPAVKQRSLTVGQAKSQARAKKVQEIISKGGVPPKKRKRRKYMGRGVIYGGANPIPPGCRIPRRRGLVSGYQLYVKGYFEELKKGGRKILMSEIPGLMKIIGSNWNGLDASVKNQWDARADAQNQNAGL